MILKKIAIEVKEAFFKVFTGSCSLSKLKGSSFFAGWAASINASVR
jgi:hypothetical protein